MTTTSVTVPECPICGERYGGPVVPHILTCCKNDVCFDCAERDRSVQVSELTGNRKRIKCMYCRELYHSTNETPWIMNRPLIKVLGIHVVDFRVTTPQCSSSSLRNESRTTTTTSTRTRTETNGHEANDPALVLEEEVPTTVEVPTEHHHHDVEEQETSENHVPVAGALVAHDILPTVAVNVPPTSNILLNNFGTAHENLLLNLDSNVPCLDALKDSEYTKKLLHSLSFRATSAFSNLAPNFPGSKYAKRNIVSDYLMFLNFAATVSYFHNHEFPDYVSEMSVPDYARQHDMYIMSNNNHFISYKQELHDLATYSKIWYGSVKNTSLEVYMKPRNTRQRIMYSYSIPWRVNEFSNKKEHNDRNKFKCFSGWLPVFQQLKYAFWK